VNKDKDRIKLKRSGVTLTELIIAMAIFAMVTVPIISMFTYSTRLSAAAYKMTMASIIAQMKMEELIGLDDDELTAEVTRTAAKLSVDDDNHAFYYRITNGSSTGFPNLREMIVIVYEGNTDNVLQEFTNIINTAPNGGV